MRNPKVVTENGWRRLRFVVVLGAVVLVFPLAECSAGGSLKVLWRTSHFAEEGRDFVNTAGLPPLAFSGNSKLLAVGRGRDVVIHDAASGRVTASTKSDDLEKKLNADFHEERCPGCMALSPDGTVLAATVAGGRLVDGKRISEIYLWEASSGRFAGSLSGHPGAEIDGILFSTSEDDPTLRLVSLGRDGYNRLWNVSLREEIFSFEAPRTSNYRSSPSYSNRDSAYFTKDGRTLITDARYEIASRAAKDGVVFSRYCVSERTHAETAPLTMSSDGKYAQLFGDLAGLHSVPGDRSILSIVNLVTRESRVMNTGKPVAIARFGPVSSRLYSLINGTVECRSVVDGSIVFSTEVSSGNALQMTISANESTLGVVEPNGSVRCFAIEDTGLKLLGNTPEETGFLWILFSPDGKYVAGSSAESGRVVVWEVPRR
jgi:WD40 repeat protein